MSETKVEKRKPGRPRKIPLKPTLDKVGILNKPRVNDNMVEIMCDQPGVFKKIGQFLKSISADKVAITFTRTETILYAKGYHGNTIAKIKLDGSKIISHYAPPEGISIVVLTANLNRAFNKLDKVHLNMSFILLKEDRCTTLHVNLQNEYDIRECVKIDIMQDPEFVKTFTASFVEMKYPLEFKLNSKYFKSAISDAKDFDSLWTIEYYNGTICFTHDTPNKQVQNRNIPCDPKKVITHSSVPDGKIFAVSIDIENLKAASAAMLSEYIHFRAAIDRSLWVCMDVHESAIQIDVLANIIDYKSKKNH